MFRKTWLSSLVVILLVSIAAGCVPTVTVSLTPAVDAPTASTSPNTPSPTDAAPTPAPVPTDQPVSFEIVQSDLTRASAPAVGADDLDTLVSGNTGFNFALYNQLGAEPGNMVYSPYSMSLALAMVYAGARGATETQIGDVMQFMLPQDGLHPAFNALDQQLTPTDDDSETSFRLNIANALWGQTGYPFASDFLDILASNYGAGLRLLDFMTSPEPSRAAINRWVEDETENRITDLLPAGSITGDTRMVLTNAIYFYGAWLFPFEENATTDGTFTRLDETTITVSMMRQAETFMYARNPNYQALVMPYEGTSSAMMILLPDAGQFAEVTANLTADSFASLRQTMNRQAMRLSMPKFEFESEYALSQTMREMGMTDAFSPALADFSGLVEGGANSGLFISDIVHKAFIKVDEAGTEAAAATGIVVGVTSIPVDEIEVQVDRPFVFIIFDQQTGSILFMGQVLDPS